MELIDGEPLSARILRGPLPQNDVLRYGAEIADALEAAHRAGIVHRDLKPGNVMITRSGTRLLDFGLAKPATAAPDDETTTISAVGTVAGTIQYMAPEQLEGRNVDARSDIFALGGVLYEMITGTRAFQGPSRASVIAAIVKDDPRPVRELQPTVTPALECIITKCLAKTPETRWQSAADIADELRWVSTSNPSWVATAVTRRRRSQLAWAAAAAVALTLGAAATRVVLQRTARPPDVVRFTVPLVGSELESYRFGFALNGAEAPRAAPLIRFAIPPAPLRALPGTRHVARALAHAAAAPTQSVGRARDRAYPSDARACHAARNERLPRSNAGPRERRTSRDRHVGKNWAWLPQPPAAALRALPGARHVAGASTPAPPYIPHSTFDIYHL